MDDSGDIQYFGLSIVAFMFDHRGIGIFQSKILLTFY